MPIKTEKHDGQIQRFTRSVDEIIHRLRQYGQLSDVDAIGALRDNFAERATAFFDEEKLLSLAVLGQVKAGKSSFLNALLFEGKDVLPKAATPKTAALTRIEYAEESELLVEFYGQEEWADLERVARSPIITDLSRSARELVTMAIDRGTDTEKYIQMGTTSVPLNKEDEITAVLNRYVGENGEITPVVKNVTLRLNLPALEGIVVVDTPGLNDPVVSRTEKTKKYLESCDVAFFLSRSGHFLDGNDLDLLTRQLPQKGLKQLYLVASLYDELLLDNIHDFETIAEADQDAKVRLRRHAAQRLLDAVTKLHLERYPQEIINVVEQCKRPIFISSIAKKLYEVEREQYSEKEQLLYDLLNTHGDLTPEKLADISNFQNIQDLFQKIIDQKEETLSRKADEFVLTANLELEQLILSLSKEVQRKAKIAEQEKAKIEEEKQKISTEIQSYRKEVADIFARITGDIQQFGLDATFILHQLGKNASLVEQNAYRMINDSKEVSDSVVYKPWTWGKKHLEYEVQTLTYTYLSVQDAEEVSTELVERGKTLLEELQKQLFDFTWLRKELRSVALRYTKGAGDSVREVVVDQGIELCLKKISSGTLSLEEMPNLIALHEKYPVQVRKASNQERLKRDVHVHVEALVTYLVGDLERVLGETSLSYGEAERYFCDDLFASFQLELNNILSKLKDKERVYLLYREILEVLERYKRN